MADPRLVAYVDAITKVHKMGLKTAREQAGKETWAGMDFPEVTLILSGLIITGRVISYLQYLKQVRDSIAAAPGNDDVRNAMLGFFSEPDFLSEEEEDIKSERIYLSNVVVMSGSSRVTCNQISIQLDSIQGWTMGQWSFNPV